MFRELIQDIQHDCYVLFLRFRLHTIRCRFDYWIDRKRLGDFNVQVEDWKDGRD